MRRRDFLKRGAAALAGSAVLSCRREPEWKELRLLYTRGAGEIERTAIQDAAELLERAIGSRVELEDEQAPPGALDVLVVSNPESSALRAGGFVIRPESHNRLAIIGMDPEGARNGLYRWLEHLGFAFFRDGETVPDLRGPARLDLELAEAPAFALRGNMVWDNYLGPRRYCASMWSEADWERALLYVARNRMNFLEFYPPLERVMARVFPEARGLSEGSVWKSEVKHRLARRVLARGRALGIRFMYVLAYGAFPEPVRALFPHLEWRNGFLCAHQPELQEMTEKLWGELLRELGTDHWYAIRHRGEEEQSYSDPCRSVTKAEGYLQAFSVLSKLDPRSSITVWTWGEKLPDLFQGFPENVRAVHVRHGMANVFGDRGEGREQRDGPPELARGRRWLSAQFTVFGGNETTLQTAWCDAPSLARDAARSLSEPSCEGFFQWPEWSDTSPWLSHAVASIAWNPDSMRELEPSLRRYAAARHRTRAEPFVAGFLPLLRDGNARFTYPPRKRLVVPYFLCAESLTLLLAVRAGAKEMLGALSGASPLYQRDMLDLLTWIGLRQAQVFEAEACAEASRDACDQAERSWRALRDLLSSSPHLSIVSSASELQAVGQLSQNAVDSLWTLGCDFYNGYPLVLSPEAIELVYLPQLDALRGSFKLEDPGWFWHDFPDRRWADAVKKLPSEDASRFETEMRARLQNAVSGEGLPVAESPPIESVASVLLSQSLPAPRPLLVAERHDGIDAARAKRGESAGGEGGR